MAKPVQLSDEAYARLAAQKQTGESFSDVVLRLTGKMSLIDALKTGRTKGELQAHRRMISQVDQLDREDVQRSVQETRRRQR